MADKNLVCIQCATCPSTDGLDVVWYYKNHAGGRLQLTVIEEEKNASMHLDAKGARELFNALGVALHAGDLA